MIEDCATWHRIDIRGIDVTSKTRSRESTYYATPIPKCLRTVENDGK
jgi:hypothetical protein